MAVIRFVSLRKGFIFLHFCNLEELIGIVHIFFESFAPQEEAKEYRMWWVDAFGRWTCEGKWWWKQFNGDVSDETIGMENPSGNCLSLSSKPLGSLSEAFIAHFWILDLDMTDYGYWYYMILHVHHEAHCRRRTWTYMDIPANRSNSLAMIGVHGPTPATGGWGALVFHLGLTILGLAGIGGAFVFWHLKQRLWSMLWSKLLRKIHENYIYI